MAHNVQHLNNRIPEGNSPKREKLMMTCVRSCVLVYLFFSQLVCAYLREREVKGRETLNEKDAETDKE